MAIEYRWVGGESGEYVPVEVPDPVIPVAQGIAGVLPAANQAQVADTAVNPNIGVMNDTGGLATLAQQQMQNAGAQTAGTTVDQQTAAATPNLGGYSQQQVKEFLDWQQEQYDPITLRKISDINQAQGVDRYSPEMIQFAVDQLNRAKGTATVAALNKGFPSTGVIHSSSDPKSGAIMMSRPDGTTDIYYPDGTKTVAPKGVDPYTISGQYKGSTTGGYGVNPTKLGAWTGYKPAKPYAGVFPSGVSALAAQQMQNAATTPAPTTPPAPKTLTLTPGKSLTADQLSQLQESVKSAGGADAALTNAEGGKGLGVDLGNGITALYSQQYTGGGIDNPEYKTVFGGYAKQLTPDVYAKYDENGKYVGVYSSKENSLAQIATILAAPLTAGMSNYLTGALSGTLGSFAPAAAKALTSAGMAAMTGGDPLKAAAMGVASPLIGEGITKMLPEGFLTENPALGKFITNTGRNLATAALTGGDVGRMLENAAFSGIVGAGMDKTGIPSELAPVLASLLRSGTITPQAAMQMITQMGKKG